jgi:hypothetical protein
MNRARRRGATGEAENSSTRARQKLIEDMARDGGSDEDSGPSEGNHRSPSRSRGGGKRSKRRRSRSRSRSSRTSEQSEDEEDREGEGQTGRGKPTSPSPSADKEDKLRKRAESPKAEESADGGEETESRVKLEKVTKRRTSPRKRNSSRRSHEVASEEESDEGPRWQEIIQELTNEDDGDGVLKRGVTRATKRQLREVMQEYDDSVNECSAGCRRTGRKRGRATEWRCANPGCSKAICGKCKKKGAKVLCRNRHGARNEKCSWFPIPDKTDYTYDSSEVGKFVLNKFDNGQQKGVILQANEPWYLILWDDGLLMEVEDITRITENYRRFRRTGIWPTRDEFTRSSSSEDEKRLVKKAKSVKGVRTKKRTRSPGRKSSEREGAGRPLATSPDKSKAKKRKPSSPIEWKQQQQKKRRLRLQNVRKKLADAQKVIIQKVGHQLKSKSDATRTIKEVTERILKGGDLQEAEEELTTVRPTSRSLDTYRSDEAFREYLLDLIVKTMTRAKEELEEEDATATDQTKQKCGRCDGLRLESETFCGNCGHRYPPKSTEAQVCSHSGAERKNKWHYCTWCGGETPGGRKGQRFCTGCGKDKSKSKKWCDQCGRQTQRRTEPAAMASDLPKVGQRTIEAVRMGPPAAREQKAIEGGDLNKDTLRGGNRPRRNRWK